MKKFIFLVAGVAGLFFVNGCVESSQKYKNLLATVDTLKAVNASQAAEMENLCLWRLREMCLRQSLKSRWRP